MKILCENLVKLICILLEKYDKFKRRTEIINNPNKNYCPQLNFENFLEKIENTNHAKYQKRLNFYFKCFRFLVWRIFIRKNQGKSIFEIRKNKSIIKISLDAKSIAKKRI